jgi:ATP-dependent Clp protease protease subunit
MNRYDNMANPMQAMLQKDRTIPIVGEINKSTLEKVMVSISYLESLDPAAPIALAICSQGGDVESGLGIIDYCRSSSCPVHTLGTGVVASMVAVILACAAKPGNRKVTRNAQILIHQIRTQLAGTYTDVQITLEHATALGTLVNSMLAEACGCDLQTIASVTERDKWMSAQDALEFGIADKIIDWK